MMNCVILDDESKAIDIIVRYIEKTPFLECKARFRDPFKALEHLGEQPIDLLFLDIDMPKLSGFELITKLNNKPLIIMTTAYSEFALHAYDLNVIDFLLKPISFERFSQAVNKAHDYFGLRSNNMPAEKSKSPASYLMLKSGTEFHRVNINDILYLEKTGNYVTIHFENKKLLIRSNFASLIEILPGTRFIRAHKSFIIAVDHISTISRLYVTIKKIKVPIGETFHNALVNKMNEGSQGLIE